MSLAFPAIATQIVRKRPIRERFRDNLRALGSPRIDDRRPPRGTGRARIKLQHSLDEEPGIPKRTAMAAVLYSAVARPRMSLVRHSASCRGRPT